MAFDITVKPDPRLRRAARLATALFNRRFREAMAEAEALAKEKVSGAVLKVRTGTLRSRITHTVERRRTEFVGRLGTNVKYAPPHELGATIPPHTIRPRRSKALRFLVGGQVVFARFANIPAITLPPRPFLRPSVQTAMERLKERIEADLPQLFAGGPA